MSETAPTDVAAVGPLTHPVAGLDRRFYAFAVDRVVAWSVDALAVWIAWTAFLDRGQTWTGVAVIAGTVGGVGLGYAVLVGLTGLSPGKALFGLRVVHHETGRPVGVPRALLRSVILGAATLPTFGLGVATLAWTAVADPGRQRRGWHDHLTRSLVVDVRPPPVEPDGEAEAPRRIVNLTAMRLVPAAPPLAEPVPSPSPGRVPPARSAPLPPPADPPPRPTAEPPPATGPAASPPPPAPPRVLPPAPVPAPDRTVVRGSGAASGLRWRVAFDSGDSFVVEGLAIVGRRPEARPGEPVRHVVPLPSADMSLSKTHAQVHLAPDGVLVVMDRGSTNGSVLVRHGVTRDLTAGKPATLLDGDRVRFGDREMTVSRDG
jgi:uncharacterized RDD family membrane protein YckC